MLLGPCDGYMVDQEACHVLVRMRAGPLHPMTRGPAPPPAPPAGMISGTGSTLFEELGLYYIGPLDGHNVDDLVAVLNGRGPKGGGGRMKGE